MATPETNRTRRFSLPDLADERTDEAISAFLSGPEHRRGRPDGGSVTLADAGPFTGLAGRLAWTEALKRESARNRRYLRPAAIVVIAAGSTANAAAADQWLARVAVPIAHAVRRGVRDADLVTRTATVTFQILLPETTELQATRFAERVIADCDVWLRAMSAPVHMRAAAAGTSAEETIEDALERALQAIKVT
jgi:GGDEF domain-containing protein